MFLMRILTTTQAKVKFRINHYMATDFKMQIQYQK